MKKLYVIEKTTGKILTVDLEGFIEIIEINEDIFDGVSYWECKCCKTIFDRWTMKERNKKIRR